MSHRLFIVICRRLNDGYMVAGLTIERPAPTGCTCCGAGNNFNCSAGIGTPESAAAQYSMAELRARKLMPRICNLLA
jgi:hypothetical protein